MVNLAEKNGLTFPFGDQWTLGPGHICLSVLFVHILRRQQVFSHDILASFLAKARYEVVVADDVADLWRTLDQPWQNKMSFRISP